SALPSPRNASTTKRKVFSCSSPGTLASVVPRTTTSTVIPIISRTPARVAPKPDVLARYLTSLIGTRPHLMERLCRGGLGGAARELVVHGPLPAPPATRVTT